MERERDCSGGPRKIYSGKGCVDQAFVLKQMAEKERDKRKELYAAFVDLEKECDKV